MNLTAEKLLASSSSDDQEAFQESSASLAEQVGERLEFIRLSLKTDDGKPKSESAFAKFCGVSVTAMGTYLDKKSLPGGKHLNSISEATGFSTDWILTGEGPMYRHANPGSVDSLVSADAIPANLKPRDPRSLPPWVRCRAQMLTEAFLIAFEATKHLSPESRPTEDRLWEVARIALDGAFK